MSKRKRKNNYNLARASSQDSSVPRPEKSKLDKIAFYFGDVHRNYTLDKTNQKEHKARLVDAIHTCSQLNRIEIGQLDRRSTGGTEKIPISNLKQPSLLKGLVTEDVRDVYSMRFTRHHRLIGIFQENIFIVLFVDYDLAIYSH